MKTKHAPGPWQWVGTIGNPKLKAYLRGPGFQVLADPSGLDVSEADAALIAAAPELLSALKAVIYDLQYGTAGRWKGKGSESLVAAIAKAETP